MTGRTGDCRSGIGLWSRSSPATPLRTCSMRAAITGAIGMPATRLSSDSGGTRPLGTEM